MSVEPGDLSPEDQLTYWIGNIIRNDVFAEDEARLTWYTLAGPGPANRLIDRDLARVLDQCRKMIASPSIHDDIRKIASGAFDATARAHRTRSELAHDRWMHDLFGGNMVLRLREPRTPDAIKKRPLSDFKKCSEDLLMAGWRMRGLRIVLPQWLGQPSEFRESPERIISWTRIATGHFKFENESIKAIRGKVPAVQVPLISQAKARRPVGK